MSIHSDFDERLRLRLHSQLRIALDCVLRAINGSDRSLTSSQARQYVAAQNSQAYYAILNAQGAAAVLLPDPPA